MSTVKEALEQRGWAVFPQVVDPGRCRAVLDDLAARWSGWGRPALYSREDIVVAPNVIVSPVGLAVHGYLEHVPSVREMLLPHGVLAAVESVLGRGFVLEGAAGVLSDQTRPFFFWHHHLGGIIDAKAYALLEDRYPRIPEIRRVSCTFYPVPLDDEHGSMLILPRRLGEPTAPPRTEMDRPWPEQHVLQCPAGSVVLMDQSVWHAVTPMTRPGQRAFVGGFLTASGD